MPLSTRVPGTVLPGSSLVPRSSAVLVLNVLLTWVFFQDCAPGYTRTGGGLYLGHCELCECNGHSDSCHPETGICTVGSPGRVSPGPSRRRRPLTWRVPPLRAACTTLRGSCVSSVPPGSSATPRWEPRRTASPAPALTPTRTTSELCPLTGPGFNPPPAPLPVNLPLVLQVLPDLREPWERRLPVHGVPARLHGPVLRTVRLIFSPALLTPLSWCLPSPPSPSPPQLCSRVRREPPGQSEVSSLRW